MTQRNEPGVAVVTGAGTGIGRAVALAMQEAGWKTVLLGRRVEPLAETAAQMAAGQPAALVVPTDVADADAVDAAFARAVAAHGRVDFLFNNAGIGARPVEIDALEIEEWRRVVDVNLSGAFYCARAAFRQMKAQSPKGGRIVNNGSISAHVPRPFSAPYTATKHAITGLTRSLSLDGRSHDIACGQIDIGNAATPMTEPMATGVLQPDGRSTPEPRMDVAHVGQAVLSMAALPLDANVQFMTIMATSMPFIGRG